MHTGDSNVVVITLEQGIITLEPSSEEALAAHTKSVRDDTYQTLRSIESFAIIPDRSYCALDLVRILEAYGDRVPRKNPNRICSFKRLKRLKI